MYDFRIEAADKPALYRELVAAADALTAGEPDAIANMANVAALLWEALPDLNWAGFYRNVGGELVLGPFQGRPACIRIPFGKGVCGDRGGDAASRNASRTCMPFPAISPATPPAAPSWSCRSSHGGALIGVLDLDSPLPGRFDEEDVAGCAELAQRLEGRLGGISKGSAKRKQPVRTRIRTGFMP